MVVLEEEKFADAKAESAATEGAHTNSIDLLLPSGGFKKLTTSQQPRRSTSHVYEI